MSVSVLVAIDAKNYEILSRIIAEAAARLNVVNLKIFHLPVPLASPTVAFQDFTAELAISFRIKPQPGPLCSDSFQNVTWTSSSSCFRCDFGRPMTSRERQGNKASRLPASKLTPARKSAQIISKQ